MATVPFQNTPSEQLRVGSAPQMSATNVRPMDDVVTDDIQKSSQAFNQFAQIAKTIQLEKDDAKSKELSNEYQTRALEIENSYLALEQGNAVAQVGTGDDGKPIFAYDQKVNDLNALKEEIAEKAENKNQLAIYNEKTAASLYSSTNRMSKHSLAEQTKYANTNALADINNTAIEAALSVDDFNLGQDSEYVKNLLALDVKIKNYLDAKGVTFIGDSNGSEINSESYINLRNGFLNDVHDSAINKLMQGNEYRKVKDYLDWNEKNGTISSAQLNKHIKTVTTAIKKENGDDIVESIISSKDLNSNDGGATSSINFIMSLESSNNVNNKNGLPYQEGNGKEITHKNLENLQNTSKFYRADATVFLPPEHRTTHLFLTKELGVEEADKIFTKATTLLKEDGFVIDKERMKIDNAYAAEVNTKLIEKTMAIGKVELTKKYGVGNELDIANKDLDFVVSKIDYTYAETQQPQIRVDELGVFNLEDALTRARDNIQDKTVLEYVETNLKSIHNERKVFAETNYDEALDLAKEKAFAEEGGWTKIKAETFEKFTREDKQILKNGHPEESDTDTYTNLSNDVKEILPENINKYRHLLSKEHFRKLKIKGENIANGGEGKILEATMDTQLFKDILAKNGFEDIVFGKGKNNLVQAKKYNAIFAEVENRIDYAQRISGKKLTREEKANFVYNVISDKVNIDNRNFLYDEKGKLYSGVDRDNLDDTYVNVQEVVNGKLTTTRIYGNQIPTKVLTAIQGSLYQRGLPMSQLEIAKEWVKFGKPMTLNEADKNIKATKIYGLMAG